ncbi:MAG: 50S ribosomal protein L11 methyltransferase [Bacteroidota bacterium]
MNFVQLKITCNPELGEILVAELSQIQFDSFEETKEGLSAACDESVWDEKEATQILNKYGVEYNIAIVPQVNWNEEWEKHYDPVKVGDQIFIGATFHTFPSGYKYYLRINPKMSFGTGHHATTSQVLEAQLEVDHQNKRVLDVGCGTGVLSILASQLGAAHITAIDIDEWCIENSLENFALNQCKNIDLRLSEIDEIQKAKPFDIILANINRNVLLEQMADYAARLVAGGYLLMSGFYREDVEALIKSAETNGLYLVFERSRDKWAILLMKKGES